MRDKHDSETLSAFAYEKPEKRDNRGKNQAYLLAKIVDNFFL